MSYAVEGGGSKTCSKAKRWLYEWPEASHRLLQMLSDLNVDYLVEQVKAGAQMVQVFESNAEYLTEELFRKFSLPYLSEIAKRVKEKLRKENIEPVPMVSQLRFSSNLFTRTLLLMHKCTIYKIVIALF